MTGFKSQLFCCHQDLKVCLITCFVPCFTQGKVYAKMGDKCLTCGLLACVPIVNIYLLAKVREKVRSSKSIEGTFPMDCILSCFCGGCVLCQAAREVDALNNLEIERA